MKTEKLCSISLNFSIHLQIVQRQFLKANNSILLVCRISEIIQIFFTHIYMQFLLSRIVEALEKTNSTAFRLLLDMHTFCQCSAFSSLMGKERMKDKELRVVLSFLSLPVLIFSVSVWLMRGINTRKKGCSTSCWVPQDTKSLTYQQSSYN